MRIIKNGGNVAETAIGRVAVWPKNAKANLIANGRCFMSEL
jgi:hypothetical protein